MFYSSSMNLLTRKEHLHELFPSLPSYRFKQLEEALFSEAETWEDVSNLPKDVRKALSEHVPFEMYQNVEVLSSPKGDAHKAVLTLLDDYKIETVLMKNTRDQWTVCLSSQVGCAMRCAFCATGKMGLKRQLLSDEIVDQFRLWVAFLKDHGIEERISNVVYMGMGEPLANYEAVKDSLNMILAHTDIGPTKITVSTVGIFTSLETLLTDPDWPHVRLAISLHSADPELRPRIVPSCPSGFHDDLKDWARRYLSLHGNRRHHLTFEYILLKGVNDREKDIKGLIDYVRSVGRVKVNLIPFNATTGAFQAPEEMDALHFAQRLREADIPVTIRGSLGADIQGACGQLVTESS